MKYKTEENIPMTTKENKRKLSITMTRKEWEALETAIGSADDDGDHREWLSDFSTPAGMRTYDRSKIKFYDQLFRGVVVKPAKYTYAN